MSNNTEEKQNRNLSIFFAIEISCSPALKMTKKGPTMKNLQKISTKHIWYAMVVELLVLKAIDVLYVVETCILIIFVNRL